MRWNENFGTTGAWDPAGCTLIETNALETKCECVHFGAQVRSRNDILVTKAHLNQIEDSEDWQVIPVGVTGHCWYRWSFQTIIKCLQTVVLEQTQQWHHEDVCDPENLIKRVGIGASCVLLLLFAVVTYAGKGVWDMFHAIR